jgi:hypothetical protein
MEDTLLAFPMEGRFAHFTVGGCAPLQSKQTTYTPIVPRQFYQWGLNCSMVDMSDLPNFILPPADKMATAVTDSINYHLDTARGQSSLHAL